MTSFKLHSNLKPKGSQPEAINQLVQGINNNLHYQTLLGITGSGKTYTMANVIEKVKSFLEDDELDIVTANNPRQALELIGEGRTFDLILVDTPMPGSDKDALFLMKPNSKLTDSETNTFLQKPFTKDQLLNFVKGKI